VVGNVSDVLKQKKDLFFFIFEKNNIIKQWGNLLFPFEKKKESRKKIII